MAAIQDICPHRGARLSEGDCHYRGTVACPYHGWVYDESGKNVMVLSEGPNSGVCGKAGTEAKAYPDPHAQGPRLRVDRRRRRPRRSRRTCPRSSSTTSALVLIGQVHWRCNWEVALENSMDSHVNYVHRNAVVVTRSGFIARGAQGEHPIFVGNGFGGDVAESNYMRQNPRPGRLRRRPQVAEDNYRRLWTWLTQPLADRARRHIPPPRSARWCGGHHLPGMFRAEFGWDLYTRMCVPVEEHLTRVWYYHCTRPKTALGRIWERLVYAALHRWIIEYNFSRQDERVMLNQRYDTPEKLSGTDAEVIQWRRLVVTKQFGGRDAPFEYKNPDGLSPDAVPLERVSVRYLQEQMRRRAAPRRRPRAESRRRHARDYHDPCQPRGVRKDRDGRRRMSRRQLMRAVLVGVAASLARPAAAANVPPEWPQVLAAAKKEGKVVVNTFPGDGYKRALKAFTQAYPDIKLEHTGLHSQDFAPRIMQERQANLFTWDVATIPTSTALQVLRPAGVWDPVRPGHRACRGQGRRGLGGRLRARLRLGEGPRARLRLRRGRAARASPSTPTW